MKVLVNNQQMQLNDGDTVASVIAKFGAVAPFAVALNGSFVGKGQYAQTALRANDKIEILAPIQGG